MTEMIDPDAIMIDLVFGFYAFYGFCCRALLVLLAKEMRSGDARRGLLPAERRPGWRWRPRRQEEDGHA